MNRRSATNAREETNSNLNAEQYDVMESITDFVEAMVLPVRYLMGATSPPPVLPDPAKRRRFSVLLARDKSFALQADKSEELEVDEDVVAAIPMLLALLCNVVKSTVVATIDGPCMTIPGIIVILATMAKTHNWTLVDEVFMLVLAHGGSDGINVFAKWSDRELYIQRTPGHCRLNEAIEDISLADIVFGIPRSFGVPKVRFCKTLYLSCWPTYGVREVFRSRFGPSE
jgi:hypothetical protein